MIEQDTIRLLRECDSGIKMGITAIDEVMDHVKGDNLRGILHDSKSESQRLQCDLQKVLDDYHDDGKEPNPIVQGMSWVKTNWEMMMDGTDSKIAELMMDGCNMGIKSLSKYLNQYAAAEEYSKDITKKLIALEEELARELRGFL